MSLEQAFRELVNEIERVDFRFCASVRSFPGWYANWERRHRTVLESIRNGTPQDHGADPVGAVADAGGGREDDSAVGEGPTDSEVTATRGN